MGGDAQAAVVGAAQTAVGGASQTAEVGAGWAQLELFSCGSPQNHPNLNLASLNVQEQVKARSSKAIETTRRP